MTKKLKISKKTSTINELRIRNSKGFTMVEIMVVIGILAIILAIAVPNFAAMQRKTRIRAGAQEIAQDFRFTRERALAIGSHYNIITTADRKSYKIIDPNGDTTTYKLGSTTGGDLKFGSTVMGAGVPEGSGAIPGNGWDFPLTGTLTFEPRGRASNGAAYITDGKETFAVGVNPLGKIRIYKYRGGWIEI